MKRSKLRAMISGDSISAFIGPGTEFQGELVFKGVLRLDGKFSGEIKSDGTLVIGETAYVAAEISVATVIVSGEVHGNIRARERIEFHRPARLYGNIVSPVLIIDEGVIFEGNCEMAAVVEDNGPPNHPSLPPV